MAVFFFWSQFIVEIAISFLNSLFDWLMFLVSVVIFVLILSSLFLLLLVCIVKSLVLELVHIVLILCFGCLLVGLINLSLWLFYILLNLFGISLMNYTAGFQMFVSFTLFSNQYCFYTGYMFIIIRFLWQLYLFLLKVRQIMRH